jgi:hypothetical protein
VEILLRLIGDMGYDPMKTSDFKKAMLELFHIEIVNMPDMASGRFILAPNHVSDMDALILGLLHPGIRIVSKDDWTSNEKLRKFLDLHYDLYGFVRTSVTSIRGLLVDAIDYFADQGENKHFLIFSQGTISDFSNNSPERISPMVQKLSGRTGVPIVNVFVEQVSLYHPTRIVFDTPYWPGKKDDFRKIWLEREAAMQNALTPPARRPVLSQKHANNNRPGDPFF